MRFVNTVGYITLECALDGAAYAAQDAAHVVLKPCAEKPTEVILSLDGTELIPQPAVGNAGLSRGVTEYRTRVSRTKSSHREQRLERHLRRLSQPGSFWHRGV